MKPKLPIASWSVCTETRLNLAIQACQDGFVIQLTGNDPTCCEEYGPYQQLGMALDEVNKRFGQLIEHGKTI